jgi:hypothetical protein
MHLKPDSPRRENEERRYFPDWSTRLTEVREEVEADHNSYLAGGYAEEFGYRAQPGSSRGVPLLDGELPEETMEWYAQAGVTHPGYPITPRPVSPDGEQTGTAVAAVLESQRPLASHEPATASALEMQLLGTFVRVTDRPYERARHHADQRAAAVLTRFLAGLVTLRWGLPHHRRFRV